jgi:hypothetical protein
MQIFEIQGPDGTVFEVEADTIEQAAAAVSGMGKPDKPWFQSLKENLLGDNDPNTQNTGEKIGTMLNKAGESLTFGLVGDEASAAAAAAIPGGMGYNDRLGYERQQEALLDETNPGLALGADVAGAVGGALLPLGAIGTLGRGAGMWARVGASTAAGAGMGGTAGFMEGEGLPDRINQGTTGAIVGGGIGMVAPIIGAGAQKIADGRAGNRAIRQAVAGAPTTDALRAEGRAAYQAIDNAGVQIRPDRVRTAMDDIANSLRSEGAAYTGAERVLPGATAILSATDDVAAKSNTVPFAELDMFRRYVGNAAAGALKNNPNDARISTNVIGQIDDFVRNLGPGDVDAGDIQTLQTMLPKARETWARMSRSQLLDDAIEAGEGNYRTGAASGVRAQFQRILNNPKLRAGFSDAELKMVRRVVNGTLPEQIMNYLGSGLGMIAQGAVGGMLGGVPGALVGGALGAGSRAGANAMVGRNAEIARALVASGRVPQLPVASPSVRAITEALARRTGAAVPQ